MDEARRQLLDLTPTPAGSCFESSGPRDRDEIVAREAARDRRARVAAPRRATGLRLARHQPAGPIGRGAGEWPLGSVVAHVSAGALGRARLRHRPCPRHSPKGRRRSQGEGGHDPRGAVPAESRSLDPRRDRRRRLRRWPSSRSPAPGPSRTPSWAEPSTPLGATDSSPTPRSRTSTSTCPDRADAD